MRKWLAAALVCAVLLTALPGRSQAYTFTVWQREKPPEQTEEAAQDPSAGPEDEAQGASEAPASGAAGDAAFLPPDPAGDSPAPETEEGPAGTGAEAPAEETAEQTAPEAPDAAAPGGTEETGSGPAEEAADGTAESRAGAPDGSDDGQTEAPDATADEAASAADETPMDDAEPSAVRFPSGTVSWPPLDEGYVPDPEKEARLAELFKASGAKSGAFIITRRGQPLVLYAAGYRDTHKNPADPDTAYHIASVTKMVTAIGLMRLVEDGLLDLDDDISHYLPMRVSNPACPEVPITMRQVLSHTSTLKQSSRYKPDWEHLTVSNDVFYKNLLPGEKYYYANLNGGLAGAMIEAVSGLSVNTYMKLAVFGPLGIDAAYSPNLLTDQENIGALMTKKGKVTSNPSRQVKLAQGYDDTCDPAVHTDRTAGALYISAAGLSRLMTMMVLGGEVGGVRILKEETIRLMEADQASLPDSSVTGESPYGLFVTHYSFGGPVWYGHQGRFNGLTSDAFYQPQTGLTFVMVVNGYGGKSNDGLANLARNLMTWIDSWTNGATDGI